MKVRTNTLNQNEKKKKNKKQKHPIAGCDRSQNLFLMLQNSFVYSKLKPRGGRLTL